MSTGVHDDMAVLGLHSESTVGRQDRYFVDRLIYSRLPDYIGFTGKLLMNGNSWVLDVRRTDRQPAAAAAAAAIDWMNECTQNNRRWRTDRWTPTPAQHFLYRDARIAAESVARCSIVLHSYVAGVRLYLRGDLRIPRYPLSPLRITQLLCVRSHSLELTSNSRSQWLVITVLLLSPSENWTV